MDIIAAPPVKHVKFYVGYSHVDLKLGGLQDTLVIVFIEAQYGCLTSQAALNEVNTTLL